MRYKEAEPYTLIGSTFRMDGEEFIIQDLELLLRQTKDVATLKRISDGQIFQDKDFASTKPFKLNLQSPTQTKNLVHHNSKIK